MVNLLPGLLAQISVTYSIANGYKAGRSPRNFFG